MERKDINNTIVFHPTRWTATWFMKALVVVLSCMIITACGYIAEARDDANRAELLSGSDDGGAASGAAASGGAVTPSATAGVEPVPSPTATPEPKTLYETYKNAPALTRVIIKGHTKKEIKEMFYVKKIPKKVWKDMQGKSYHKGCPVKKSGLRLIRVLYRGYDKKTYIGELVAAKRVSEEFKEIIYKLYKKKYQFGKIQRIDAYGGDDDASIADDNTSCFNHRVVAGSSNLSKHAYGIAIDINPLYNPYVCWVNGKMKVSPPKAKKYANRKKKFKHKITKQDLCYKYFHKKGYFWGGDWRTIKDYQHFQKQ